MLIAAGQCPAAIERRDQIERLLVGRIRPVALDRAIDAKPRHPAVGKMLSFRCVQLAAALTGKNCAGCPRAPSRAAASSSASPHPDPLNLAGFDGSMRRVVAVKYRVSRSSNAIWPRLAAARCTHHVQAPGGDAFPSRPSICRDRHRPQHATRARQPRAGAPWRQRIHRWPRARGPEARVGKIEVAAIVSAYCLSSDIKLTASRILWLTGPVAR